MYSRSIVCQKLDRHEAKTKRPLVYHTIEQIDEFTKHLQLAIDDQGRFKRNLVKDEVDFIQNERALIKLDFRYYAQNYAYIKDTQGRVRRFFPNVAQEVMLSIWGRLEEMGRSVSCQILKARQLGMSTLSEISIAHRVQTTRDFTAVIGSSNPEKSTLMAQMTERVWENMPWWLMPEKTRYMVGELVEFGKMGSKLSIQHGSQRAGIARGDTVQGYHLSECADFIDPKEIIDASLDRATHEFPGLIRLKESTAKGKGEENYWYQEWQINKELYWEGRSNFCPTFLPWFVGTDIYPTPTWLVEHPIPPNWQPNKLTEQHAKRAQSYVKNNELLADLMGQDWAMPFQQQWFWEVDRGIAERKQALAKFYEEMPADDNEAFQSSGHAVFAVDLIAQARENALAPIGVYGVVGDPAEINLLNQPDRRDIDETKQTINITAAWHSILPPHEYQLVPLKMDKYGSTLSLEGRLVIWEMPEDDWEYRIGIDTSEGIGLDRSVIQVIRKGNLWRNDAQVAEFASKTCGALDLWPIALALGTLYAVRIQGKRQQPMMVIECAANGEATQRQLINMGWSRMLPWIRYDKRKIDQSKAQRFGWYTTSWSRPLALEYFIKAFRDGWLEINSPELLNEMSTLEKEGPRGKLEAALGSYDDRVMSLAIAFVTMHILDLRNVRQDMSLSAQRTREREESRMAPNYQPGWQGQDMRVGFYPFGQINDMIDASSLDGLRLSRPETQEQWATSLPTGGYF